MIAYFTKPHPDEIFYSMAARYAQHTNSTRSQLVKDLFGLQNVTSNFHMPNKLEAVADRISGVIDLTLNDLLEQNTLYPFYSAFGSAKRAARIREFMTKGGDRFVANRIEGLDLGTYKYCSLCAQEEREKVGEAYWHRCHNLPSVVTCTRHGVRLKAFESRSLHLEYQFISADSVIGFDYDSVPATKTEIAEDIMMEDILFRRSVIDFKLISRMAIDKGFLRISGNKYFPMFNSKIRSYVEQNHPRFAHLVTSRNMDWRLPIILSGYSEGTQPRLCALIKEFVETQPSLIKDFEVKCHNKTCSHFNLNLPNGSWQRVKKMNNTIIYIANCHVCGHKFRGNSDTKKIISLAIGETAVERIKMQLANGTSRRSIFREYGLGRDFLHKIMNEEPVSKPNARKFPLNKTLQKKYRRRWLEGLRSGRYKCVQEMIDAMSNVQSWLYRNDRQWVLSMNAKYLKPMSRARMLSPDHYRDLDDRVLSQLQRFVDNFKFKTNTSRLTKSLMMANITGSRSLDIENLPNSFSFLKRNVETSSDYVKRKTRMFENVSNI